MRQWRAFERLHPRCVLVICQFLEASLYFCLKQTLMRGLEARTTHLAGKQKREFSVWPERQFF
jgi:hypothetical protein